MNEKKAAMEQTMNFGNGYARVQRIRELNDQLRTTGRGGRVMLTDGLLALDRDLLREIVFAVAVFDAFTPDNDPWGEHDCAVLEVHGYRIIWKIDAYDHNLVRLSPDPSNPRVTTRVMTIMLAEEY